MFKKKIEAIGSYLSNHEDEVMVGGYAAMIGAYVIFMIGMIALVIWADKVDPAPKGILIGCIILFGGVIIGVIIALVQRLKEEKGGELDEAGKY